MHVWQIKETQLKHYILVFPQTHLSFFSQVFFKGKNTKLTANTTIPEENIVCGNTSTNFSILLPVTLFPLTNLRRFLKQINGKLSNLIGLSHSGNH